MRLTGASTLVRSVNKETSNISDVKANLGVPIVRWAWLADQAEICLMGKMADSSSR